MRGRHVLVWIGAAIIGGCSLITNLDGLHDASDSSVVDGGGEGGADAAAVPLDHAISVGAGQDHSCAVVDDGGVLCWGNNVTGQLGVPADSIFSSLHPIAVQGLPEAATIVYAGFGQSCAIVKSGALYCWGANGRGQLGIPPDNVAHAPVLISADAGALSSVSLAELSVEHQCAVSNGTLYCWGDGNLIGLANKPAMPPLPPTAIEAATHVGVGTIHTCASSGASVSCWGDNGLGELGSDAAVQNSSPQPTTLGNSNPIVLMTSGNFFTVAIDSTGVAYGWGLNSVGQLGTLSRPIALGTLPTVAGATMLTAGASFMCFIASNGELRCMGSNSDGELGIGVVDEDIHATPMVVGGDGGVTDALAVSGRFLHVCAIRKGGGTRATNGVVCWGKNDNGQLGDGTTTRSAVPVDVMR